MRKFISIFIGGLFLVLGWVYFSFAHPPLVSVILLTYNRQDLLPRAIDSILNQTYKNFELIIINDGSTDNTDEIIEKYARQDKRIVVVRNDVNQGILYNRNKGLIMARGEYIAWQDDDDISYPTRLEEQVDFLQEHKDITILGTQMHLIGSDKSVLVWPRQTSPQEAEIDFLIGHLPIILGSSVWRSSFIKKHKIFFDPQVPLAEDFVIYDKVLAENGKIMTLNKALYQYRLHNTNPKYYYQKISELVGIIYKERWERFFPNVSYPSKSCERLKYVKEHNPKFDQKVLDSMYSRHCKGIVFDPSSFVQRLIYEDGEEELIVVDMISFLFYSSRFKKYGKWLGVKDDKERILWDGETEPVYYRMSRQDKI